MSASSATSVAKVTATIVGAARATITTTLPAAATAATAAKPASIFDKGYGSPIAFSTSDPLVLFITQAFIIVTISRLLHLGLRYLRQPRVIAEIIAGILVGPTALGRIPGFTSNIFPTQSIPYLNLVANIGLTLFLFLVGLEVDFSLFRRNAKLSISISLVGMIVPFALGAAVSKGIYDRFIDSKTVNFGTFLLFIGTANAITAFPVLARILTDEGLLKNHVGVIVLSAGVGNDVVGWTLLALAIALVNSSTGLVVLYVILTAVGWTLTLWFIGRPVLKYLSRKTRSGGEGGPSQTMTAFTLFLVLTSAWLTDRIGIHAIFGAFLVGLVVPKEIRGPLTEKIEDLVTILFLPLYFALSGLNTNLGLLSDGSIWGWTVCVTIVAFLSKFVSCGGIAKSFGMDWRESGAVGSLMACKGLVELIVLNVGLNARILNPQVFAMFVFMALVTTFATTPLTLAFYPAWYRLKTERERRGLPGVPPPSDRAQPGFGEESVRSRFAIVIEQFEHLPAVMSFLRLLVPPVPISNDKSSFSSPAITASSATSSPSSPEKDASATAHRAVQPELSFLRLVENTDRTSALLRAAESETALLRADTLSAVLKAFATGLGAKIRHFALNIAAPDAYPQQVSEFVEVNDSQVAIVPWLLPAATATGSTTAGTASIVDERAPGVAESWLPNPFEGLFSGARSISAHGAAEYATYVRQIFAESPSDVGVFLERAQPDSAMSGRAHLFLAFHGGSDDRFALAMVDQLVKNHSQLTATVVRITRAGEPTEHDQAFGPSASETVSNGDVTKATTRDSSITQSEQPLFTLTRGGGANHGGDTIYPSTYGAGSGNRGLQSETEDDVLWARLATIKTAAADRIEYSAVSSFQPLRLALARLAAVRSTYSAQGIPLVVLAGRGRRDAPSHASEALSLLKERNADLAQSIVVSSEVRRALGDVASMYVLDGEKGTEDRILVLRKGGKRGRVPGKSTVIVEEDETADKPKAA
ncbi:hypothetical protein JCM10908_000825 [Rhodotorula pacifica]|uniref:uncharacterized protein n=1 Tax=Rhodotorula pacifica TaxID=1495444 RepID=UPI00316F48A5